MKLLLTKPSNTTKPIKSMIQVACRDSEKSNEIHFQNLQGKFKAFKMKEFKKISNYISIVVMIVYQMRRLGEDISNLKVIEKVITSLIM